jgi:hypothetical protein
MTPPLERRLLQLAVALGGCVPVGAGAAGMLLGAGLLGEAASPAVDSHVRYLSGLLFVLGLAFWAAIRRIERHTVRFRLLGAMVVAGGLARLAGVFVVGWPGSAMALALGMELAVTPALVAWQGRVARLAR